MDCPQLHEVLPIEILVEILSLLPYHAVVNFARVSKSHLNVFKQENGLWQLLTCRIQYWSINDAKSIKETKKYVDWAKEYRVTAFYHGKIINSQLKHDDRPNTSEYMPEISKNHFKFVPNPDPNVQTPIEYFSIQSAIPLYPLPLGNFSTAYFEVDVLAMEDVSSIHVGAALEGYMAMPGIGRNSYGYDNDGNIILESELSPNDVPSFTVGDIIGFGINFVKKSVFFTKNGVLIGDKTHSYLNFPVLNLKTLHACIGCLLGCEFSANFGSLPFKFDLLKYQHQYGHTESLQLYSVILLEHLFRVSDDETLAEYAKDDAMAKISTTDYNPPDPSMKLNLFLWLTHYLRDPRPNGYESDQFVQFGFSQLLISSLDVLLSWEKHEKVKMSLEQMAQSLNLEYEGLPYEDLVMSVYRAAKGIYIENVFGVIALTLDELAQTGFTEDRGLWAQVVIAFYLINSGAYPLEHYTRQAAAMYLARTFNHQIQGPTFTHQDFVTVIDNNFWFVFYATRSFARQEVILQKNIKLKERFKNSELSKEVLRVYGDSSKEDINKKIEHHIDVLPIWEEDLVDAEKIIPFKIIYGLKNRTLSNHSKSEAILYGVYYLKIEVDQFPTEEEFLSEILRKCEEMVPLQRRKELLVNLALGISTNSISVEHSTVADMFGIRCVTESHSKLVIVPAMVKKAFERIEHEIAFIDKQIQQSKEQSTPISRHSALSNSAKNIIIAASIIAVAIGGFFWYKRKK